MHVSFLKSTLSAALLSAAAWSSHAALVSASGSTVDFFYDDTGVTASVIGDRISFALSTPLQATADAGNGGLSDIGGALPNLVVVAKSGFAFSGAPVAVGASLAGAYVLPGNGGAASVFHTVNVQAGSWDGSAFTGSGAMGSAFADAGVASNGASPQSAAFVPDAASHDLLVPAGMAIGLLDIFYSAFAFQDLLADPDGVSSARIDSLSYSASAVAIAAVPEPGSLPLLLAALGLSGLLTRRNRG